MNRKNDHVHLADQFYTPSSSPFDDLRFVHQSLSTVRVDHVDLQTTLFHQNFALPFFINAMTGGSNWTKSLNQKLALVARETGLALESGSLSSALKDPSCQDSFTILRETAPQNFLIANIGANHTAKDARQVIDLLQADALAVHLNVPQEIAMPEGDRDFRPLQDNLQEILATSPVPVLVKEVGFGLSREAIQSLLDCGAQTIDLSGRGGTNFLQIENARRTEQELAYLEDWGQTTPISLLEAQPFLHQADFIASGGIHTPLQACLALSLGAQAVGMSGEFLHRVLHQEVDDIIAWVHTFQEEMQLILAMLNAPNLSALRHRPLVVLGETRDWCQVRSIDVRPLAQRCQNT